jgi:hypothetical protein
VEQFLTLFQIILPWKIPSRRTSTEVEDLAWAIGFKLTMLKTLWKDPFSRHLLCDMHAETFSDALLKNLLGYQAELSKVADSMEQHLVEPAYEIITLGYYELLCHIYSSMSDRKPLFSLLFETVFFRGLFDLLHTPDQRERAHVVLVITHAAQRILGGGHQYDFFVRQLAGLIQSGFYIFRRNPSEITLRPIETLITLSFQYPW